MTDNAVAFVTPHPTQFRAGVPLTFDIRYSSNGDPGRLRIKALGEFSVEPPEMTVYDATDLVLPVTVTITPDKGSAGKSTELVLRIGLASARTHLDLLSK